MPVPWQSGAVNRQSPAGSGPVWSSKPEHSPSSTPERPGTPAAEMDGQIPKAVVQERYERLVALQEEISWEEDEKQVGRTLELMVAEGEGRKDGTTHRLSAAPPTTAWSTSPSPTRQVRPGAW
ncbi:tRNA-2-methylthio-N(6)-dimethylallyladenosine synthase [Streptomyces violaceorubidus]